MRWLKIFIIFFVVLFSCTRIEKEYYDDGKLKSEVETKNGKKNGRSIFYYSNGRKQMECQYSNDLLDGKLTRWTYKGKVELESNYTNGLRMGETRLYTSEGILQIIQNYKNDTLDGQISEFYPNGNLKMSGNYSLGLFTGEWLYYESNGLLVGKGLFQKGNGTLQSYFYGSNKIKSITEYQNNIRNGKETIYNSDGSINLVRYFKNDLISDSLN